MQFDPEDRVKSELFGKYFMKNKLRRGLELVPCAC